MKKIVSIVLAFVLVLGCVCAVAFADSTTKVTFDKETVENGKTVVMTITMPETDAMKDMTSLGVKIAYDQDAFDYVSFPGWFGSVKNGVVTANWGADDSVAGDDISGRAFTVNFKCKTNTAGTYDFNVTFDSKNCLNSDLAPVSIDSASGNVKVEAAPCDHVWDDGVVTKEATCTEKGVKTYTCTKCPETMTEEIAVDPTNHDWNDGVVTTEPNCTEKGVKTYTCKRDASHTKTEEIAVNPANHVWDAGEVTTPATCKTTGVKTYTCTKCTETKTDTLPVDPDNHVNVVADPAVQATCQTTGLTAGSHCGDCNKVIVKQEITEKADHTPADAWSKDMTNHWKVCTTEGCGVVIENTKAAHDLQWKTDKPATEDETGLKHQECSVCGNICSEGTVIPKLDHKHNMTKHDAEKATCTDDGNVEYYTCSSSKCAGVYYADEAGTEVLTTIVVPATGHEMKPTAAVDAKCESAGNSAYWTCDNCGKFFSDDEGKTEIEKDSWVIRALTHDWDDGEVTTPATCEADGVMTYTCKRDAGHTKTETIPALTHDWDDGVVTTAATCEADGVMTYTCKRDASHTKTEAIPALDHDYKDGKCVVCGAAEPVNPPADNDKPADNKPADNKPADNNESVPTGDAGVAVWCTLLAVSAVFGTAIVMKKREA